MIGREHQAALGAERKRRDVGGACLGLVQDLQRIRNELRLRVCGFPHRAIRAAVSAPVESNDSVTTSEVWDLHLPEPRVDDRPGRHHQYRLGTRTEDLIEQL